MIRLWQIGHIDSDPTKCILPSRDQISRFREQLKNRNEDGSLDIIWTGPIKCEIVNETHD